MSQQDELTLNNLLQPAYRADPYPLYRRIREQDPVHWDEPLGFWSLARYADIVQVFHDERILKGKGLAVMLEKLPPEARARAEPVYEIFSRQMLYSDPPYHTRLRSIANKAFTRGMVERLRPTIQGIVDNLLDAAEGRGRLEIMADLAYPLPFTVIMTLIGLPLDQRDDYKQWSDDFMAALGLVRRLPAIFERAHESLAEITAELYNLHEVRHLQPRDDLLSQFVALEAQGDRLDHAELVANTIVLLAAGHETTMNLIGNGTLALLRQPDQMALLREDPSLIENAVDELQRYDNPTQIVWRISGEDIELGGRRIAQGQFLNLLVASANRDPEQYPDPDRVDVRREVGRHLGFGMGTHYCLGAPLARLEGQIAIGTLVRRYPNLRLDADRLEWHDNPTFRSLKALPVAA
jgi:cytochrome P450